VEFRNSQGLTLRGVVHKPRKYKHAILYLHGFPSTMNGSPLRFGRALAPKGYLFMRFDFSGSGSSEGKYENKLMSDEVKDVHAAIDFLHSNYDFDKLVLVGHSTGAIDAALYAHTDKRVKAVVLSGAVNRLDNAARYDFTDKQVRDFWLKGWAYHPPLERQQEKRHRKRGSWVIPKKGKLRKQFYDEFFKLDLTAAIKKYRRPLLVLHGEKDEAIPTKEPLALFALANKPKQLVIIRGADHSFKKKGTFKPAVDAISRFISSAL
jgi:uncharacterized protein